MRKIMRAICGVLAVLMIAACGLFFYTILNAPLFESGECYTYYTEKNSSCKAYVTNSPALQKLLLGHVSGESVRYEGNLLKEIAEKFEARLLFTEEACGIVNFYFRSPKLKDFVEISGYPVNLHIALSEDKTVVGTPIIFGGF